MHVLEAIRARRTVHDYEDRPVDEALLDEALAAAHLAPCHKLTWPWRFVKVGKVTRAQLVPLAIAHKEAKGALSDEGREKVRRKIMNPAWLIAVGQRKTDDAFRAKEDYAATSCAVQNLALALRAHDVFTKWSTGAITRDPKTYEILGVDPDESEIVGFVWVGHPARVPDVSRPPLDDYVRALP